MWKTILITSVILSFSTAVAGFETLCFAIAQHKIDVISQQRALSIFGGDHCSADGTANCPPALGCEGGGTCSFLHGTLVCSITDAVENKHTIYAKAQPAQWPSGKMWTQDLAPISCLQKVECNRGCHLGDTCLRAFGTESNESEPRTPTVPAGFDCGF